MMTVEPNDAGFVITFQLPTGEVRLHVVDIGQAMQLAYRVMMAAEQRWPEQFKKVAGDLG